MTGPDERERLARVVLSRIGEPGDPRLTDLVHELGAKRVLASLRAQAADKELGCRPRGAARVHRPGEGARACGGDGDPVRRTRRHGVARLPGRPRPRATPARTWWRPARSVVPRCTAAGRGHRARRGGGGLALGHDVRRRGRHRDRHNACRGVVERHLGGGVRHRPGGAPRRARQPGQDRRGARLRRRPGLPGRPPQPDRLHRRRGVGGLRGSARLRPDPHPVPRPQPHHRCRRARRGRRRGRGTQRRAEHRELGGRSRSHGDGGARSGHERALGRRAPADPCPRRPARDLRGGGPRGRRSHRRLRLGRPARAREPAGPALRPRAAGPRRGAAGAGG